MASTEQRAGFRLPWGGSSSAPSDTEEQADEAAQQLSQAPTEVEDADAVEEVDRLADPWPSMEEMGVAAVDEPIVANENVTDEAPAFGSRNEVEQAEEDPSMSIEPPRAVSAEQAAFTAPAPSAPQVNGRKPQKFLAELVRAMRAAAEESQTATLEGFRVEAKTFVEGIHTRSADEATELRRIADDDVAGIREWSKAEVARVRSETDERITGRKEELEQHLEDHAALIEREIEMVQSCVGRFEREMEEFFARLAEVEDPATFAATAQQLPEPPSLAAADAAARSQALTDLVRGSRDVDLMESREPAHAEEPASVAVAEPVAEAVAQPVAVEPVAVEPVDEPAVPVETEAVFETPEPESLARGEDEATEFTSEARLAFEAAFAPGGETADAPADAAAEVVDPEPEIGDPRLAALGLTGDYATAESEAAVDAATEDTDNQSIDDIDPDSLAARLAGLVPSSELPASSRSADEPATEMAATHVVVVGLVSVASIASFKRHLGRIPGVQSVGVTSGPDGEFVFKAVHEPGVALREIIPTLPGFGARVVNTADGVLNVSARDPETDA
jgi:hypothetical protein